MIIVTGGAGFIGSNLVCGLNKLGRTDILVVDDLQDGTKFKNIVNCKILDYLDKEDFLNKIKRGDDFKDKIEVVFHEGACSNTMEWDGAYMLKNNYEYSKHLLHYCLARQVPFIYASSAALYGQSKNFAEHPDNEHPINVYGYSKLLFDQYVRRSLPTVNSQVVGLRYFNVYGPQEQHKGKMASVIWHFNQQLLKGDTIKLFMGADGYKDGEQVRDFIFVDDVVKVNLWFWQECRASGIYNLGTGKATSFNQVGREIISWHGRGKIEYTPFPQELKGSYQSFTEADMTSLHKIGWDAKFANINYGVKSYLDVVNKY